MSNLPHNKTVMGICPECSRKDCQHLEVKQEKPKTFTVPKVGDPLNCERKDLGVNFKDGSIVRTKRFANKDLKHWKFLMVDHSDDAIYSSGYTPFGLDASDVEAIVNQLISESQSLLKQTIKEKDAIILRYAQTLGAQT